MLGETQRAEQGATADFDTPRGLLLTLTTPVLFGRVDATGDKIVVAHGR